MDSESAHLDEGADVEPSLDVWNPWNLPRAVPVPTPTPDEWPEREVRLDEGLAGLDGPPGG